MKKVPNLKSDELPNYEAWCNFFEKQGWTYKITGSGYMYVQVINYSRCLSISITKNSLRFSFYKNIHGNTKQGPVFYLNVIKGKPYLVTVSCKYNTFKVLRYFNKCLLHVLIKRQGKPKNIGMAYCASADRKFNLIIKMFMGLNKISWPNIFNNSFKTNMFKAHYKNILPALDDNEAYFFLPNSAKKWARENQMGKLAKNLYGYNSKIIRKYMIAGNFEPLDPYFKKLFNRGEIEKLATENKLNKLVNTYSKEDIEVASFFIKTYNKKKLIKFLNEPDINKYKLFDTFNMLLKLSEKEGFVLAPKSASLDEMHTYYITLQNKLKYANTKFDKRYEQLKKIDGLEVDIEGVKHKIIVPQDSHTLLAWGQKLNNCIFSYAERYAQANTNLFGVEINGQIVSTLEIDRNLRLIQFKDNFNKNVLDKVVEPIYSLIKKEMRTIVNSELKGLYPDRVILDDQGE